jgi:hypothetical protein
VLPLEGGDGEVKDEDFPDKDTTATGTEFIWYF